MKIFVCLRLIGIMLLIAGALPITAQAVTIQYEATDVPDTIPGEDVWQYTYRVSDATFNEGGINPLTVNDSTFFVERTTGGVLQIPGSVVVAADSLSATFTPDGLLQSSTSYRVRVLREVIDLVGNTYAGASTPSNLTTAAD